MDWASVTNRMKAIVEELEDADVYESDEDESDDALNEDEIVLLADLLGVEPEELLQAEDEDIASAMEYLGSKIAEAADAYVSKYSQMDQEPYDRPHSKSTQGRKKPEAKVYPRREGEEQVGTPLPTFPPSTTRMPGKSEYTRVPKEAKKIYKQGEIDSKYGRHKAHGVRGSM